MLSKELGVEPSQSVMLSIVVPTYNERENIPELIERIETISDWFGLELIIVDDNSPDETAKVAEEINDKYGNIKVLKRPGKLGLSSAVLNGFEKASAEVLAVIDADLQHPPELLPKMYEKIMDGYDLVVASRYVDGGGVKSWGLRRRLISKGATSLAHLLLPKTKKVRDPMSGYFMLRKCIINGAELNPAAGYKILLEILVTGRRILATEVPYTFKPRQEGKSKLNLREMVRYVLLLLKLKAMS